MTVQSSGTKKFNSIDIFKFFMAICVIAIHTDPFNGVNASPAVISIYSTVIKSAVPFFFLASGYLLSNKINGSFSSAESIEIIKKYLIKILKMYLMWTVIYLPLAIYEYVTEHYSVLKAVASYFRSFIFIGQHYDSWMLWYLLSTIFALLFVIILLKIKTPMKAIAAIGFIMALAGIYFDILDATPNLSGVPALLHKAFSLTFSTGRIFQGMFYIPVGMLLKKQRLPLTVNIALLAIFGTMNCLTNNVPVKSILIMIYSVGFFGIVERINLKDSKVYPTMRKMSTYMYFIHLYVFFIFTMLIYKEEKMGPVSFAATALLSIVLSFIWVKLKPKIFKKA